MPHLDFLTALLLTVLWPVGMVYCTRKYLRARKQGKTVDAWIWFACWGVILSMVEWFVFFAGSVACTVLRLRCLQ